MTEPLRLSATEFCKTFHKTPALAEYGTRCGKPTCKCASGPYRHGPYAYLLWREGSGRLCRRYVPKAEVPDVRDIVALRQMADRQHGQLRTESRAYLQTLRHVGRGQGLW